MQSISCLLDIVGDEYYGYEMASRIWSGTIDIVIIVTGVITNPSRGAENISASIIM